MNICPKCGYKVISNAMFERHTKTHDMVNEEIKEASVNAPITAAIPVDNDITIHFAKDVEIQINSVKYFGKDIKVKDMSIASEIVRLAREGYGPNILL